MEKSKSSFPIAPQQYGLTVDKTNVLPALDGLLDAGMAVLGRDVELSPLLYLLSGEIFVWRQWGHYVTMGSLCMVRRPIASKIF